MDKLSKEEVLHVANLAKLELNEDEIERFSYDLKAILDEIEKINDVETITEETMINPIDVECFLSGDIEKTMLAKEEVLKNAPRHDNNYIEVDGVLYE